MLSQSFIGKVLLLLITLSLVTFTVQSADRWGSQCGLTDGKDDVAWKSIGQDQQLTQATDQELKNLPTLTKQQLIIAAKEVAKEREDHFLVVKNTVQSVKYLRENSEAEDVYVRNYKVKKLLVTEISYWPGGNPYGYIFLSGTTRLIAFNQDDSVACK